MKTTGSKTQKDVVVCGEFWIVAVVAHFELPVVLLSTSFCLSLTFFFFCSFTAVLVFIQVARLLVNDALARDLL